MKKVLFSAAILAFAGATAFSTTSHQVNVSKSNVVWQDTTKDTTSTPTDTTSAPADTTQSK
ncbi:hypothetical protein [Arcticibacter sp. MXS-1]|uniref:hypothetical protein n=1 Tax=Arcticibacter sp. MXS-1 TaxID=3341726 RepID=UPI0035A83768